MTKYTVLLLYPDYIATQYGEETYLDWQEADSVEDAIKFAQREASLANHVHADDAVDFKPLFVCEGHHEDLIGAKS